MGLTSQAAASEHESLEKLRDYYTALGFRFIAHPGQADTPDFLGSYKPDAIALKPGENLVIEIKHGAGPATERSLNNIRRLFNGHPDWKFVVSYGGSDPFTSGSIEPASEEAIRGRLEEVRVLVGQGQWRGAFVLGWALLEAALHRLDSEVGKRPRSPGTVIETLSTLGYLTPEVQSELRPLITLRNRIVHGDIVAEPSVSDLETLIDAIDQVLS